MCICKVTIPYPLSAAARWLIPRMSRARRFQVLFAFGLLSLVLAVVYTAPLLALAGIGWFVMAFLEK